MDAVGYGLCFISSREGRGVHKDSNTNNTMQSNKPQSTWPARLEGMVVQKRLGRVETTRYLVIDLKRGCISIYREPPPDIAAMHKHKRPKSAASRLKASLTSRVMSNNITHVTELEDAHYLALAHINRERRNSTQRSRAKVKELRGESWEPKLVVPPHVDWKIR